MAELESPRGPNKRLVVGCGMGCSLFLLLVVTLLVFGYQRMQRTYLRAEEFVRAATADNPAPAYQLLHPNRRQALPEPEFLAQWVGVRSFVGAVTAVEANGPVQSDLERGVAVVPLKIVGDRGAQSVEVDLNPRDDPMLVIDYRLPGLSVAPAKASPARP
ncbi:MAG: hypothetical protein HUU35_12080 [Armatimonadetes bacterium]|nr:hypothetical protein [Armatimonadota bacterium]